MSQREAAALHGVSQNAYQGWESGDVKPKDEHFPAIFAFLGLNDEQGKELLYADTLSRAGLTLDAGKDWAGAARSVLRRKGRR